MQDGTDTSRTNTGRVRHLRRLVTGSYTDCVLPEQDCASTPNPTVIGRHNLDVADANTDADAEDEDEHEERLRRENAMDVVIFVSKVPGGLDSDYKLERWLNTIVTRIDTIATACEGVPVVSVFTHLDVVDVNEREQMERAVWERINDVHFVGARGPRLIRDGVPLPSVLEGGPDAEAYLKLLTTCIRRAFKARGRR